MGYESVSTHATRSFWSAVAQMHGASLHRSYRFREVKNVLRPKPFSGARKIANHASQLIL